MKNTPVYPQAQCWFETRFGTRSFPREMGRKLSEPYDLENLIAPIYTLTTVGVDGAGWMGYKAIPVDEPKPRTTMFLIDIGLSPKTLDAMLHIFIICLVLFIIINCMCKFVCLFLK